MKLTRLLLTSLALLAAPFAAAHPGHGLYGFTTGVLHPLTGLDHLAAMLAVGLWAGMVGGRQRWLLPLTFVATMVVGALLGVAGVHLPAVEPGIAASVLVLGLLLVSATRLPLAAAMALTSVFALCHGYAHGAELPVAANGLSFGIGFVLSTAALHALGVVLASTAGKRLPLLARLAGAVIASGGVYLLLA